MNRERLQILRDHLASLPDERVDMRYYASLGSRLADSVSDVREITRECGTAACIAGWATTLFRPSRLTLYVPRAAAPMLGLTGSQEDELFFPHQYWVKGRYTRSDAIAAIQSMLDSPDDDALPVWPERAEPSQ